MEYKIENENTGDALETIGMEKLKNLSFNHLKLKNFTTEETTEALLDANTRQLTAGMLDKSTALERVILCNKGTVQTLLSTIFHKPIKVQVISQHELADVIVRWVRLMVENTEISEPATVCLAESVIPIDGNPPDFLSAIREKRMGIGEIITAYKLNIFRNLLSLYTDDVVFARNYNILGDCNVFITETFRKDVFKKMEIL